MKSEAIIVTDLGFGDSGKGTMVDYLARGVRSSLVIRHNGGPQAAHNVITPEGKHHNFAQFGSGSFLLSSSTHLSQYMLVNPFNLYVENQYLERLGVKCTWQRLSIDHRATIITPWHQAANRIREISRGLGRHGSCGQGVGEARWDDIRFPDETIHAGNLHSHHSLGAKLRRLRDRKWQELAELVDSIEPSEQLSREVELFTSDELIDEAVEFYRHFAWLAQITGDYWLEDHVGLHERVIFEGAQGVLLDEKFGFHPYTTWTNTTTDNALRLIDDSHFSGDVTRLGVIRGYATRHGAGPFVTEDAWLTKRLPEYHNQVNDWQQAFRLGYLDLVALRYAIEVSGGVDELAVTGLDRMKVLPGWQVATAYQGSGRPAEPFLFDSDAAGQLGRIRVVRGAGNRDNQIALTNALDFIKPVYQGVATPSGNGVLASERDFGAYFDLISQGLTSPIRYASFGPTAADKQDLAA